MQLHLTLPLYSSAVVCRVLQLDYFFFFSALRSFLIAVSGLQLSQLLTHALYKATVYSGYLSIIIIHLIFFH